MGGLGEQEDNYVSLRRRQILSETDGIYKKIMQDLLDEEEGFSNIYTKIINSRMLMRSAYNLYARPRILG